MDEQEWAIVTTPEHLDIYRALTRKNGSVEIRAMDLRGEWFCTVNVEACDFEQNGSIFRNKNRIIMPELTESHTVRFIGVFYNGILCFFLDIGRTPLKPGFCIEFEPYAMHLHFNQSEE